MTVSSRLGLYWPADAGLEDEEAPSTEEAQSAAAWLRSKWEAFKGLYPKLLDLQHRAAVVAADAKRRGDLETHELAQTAIRRLADLVQLHDRTLNRFGELGGLFPGLGAVPVVPVAMAGAVLALAASVAWIFGRVYAEERVVRLLEEGTLTPEEAERILANVEGGGPGGFASGLGDAAKWIGFGLVGWLALKTFREHGGSRRSW